jgi:hypothetical protein
MMMMIIELDRDYVSRYGLPLVNKIDTLIFTTTYPKDGCTTACKDICCSGGATMDIFAFNRLVKHSNAPEFKTITWEGYAFEADVYSPGGAGCYTRFDGNRCMFQNDDWGCAIHSYCLKHKIDVHELKFFTCCLFPVEVNKIGTVHNILTAGYEMRYPQFDLPCKKNGGTPVYEIAQPDIEYYYGRELIGAIEHIKEEFIRGAYRD